MIDEALEKLGVGPAIFVVHSWAGALGARMALDYPQRVAGLVMLAPVAYPWPGGVGWYNRIVTTAGDRPAAGLHDHAAARLLSWPSPAPAACSCRRPCRTDLSRTPRRSLLLRPREFLANARDLVTLKAAVAEQAPRYGEIKAPIVIIAGDARQDGIDQHPFAAVRGRRAERQADRAARRRSHGAERRARSRDFRDRGDDRQIWRRRHDPAALRRARFHRRRHACAPNRGSAS